MRPDTPIEIKLPGPSNAALVPNPRIPASELATIDLTELQPLRSPTRFLGQRNRGGWHASPLSGRLEPFNSLLEWDWLRTLEFDITVALVRAQCVRIEGPIDHEVDFILELVDGSRVLADVRHSSLFNRVAQEQFTATQRLAETIGVGYVVLDETATEAIAASRDYSPCRLGRTFASDAIEAVERVVTDDPVTVNELAARAGLGVVETVGAARHLIGVARVHAESIAPRPSGISNRTGLWLEDPLRVIALRNHEWRDDRTAGLGGDGAAADVPHTKSYPPEAVDLGGFEPLAVNAACAAFDVLAQYAQAHSPAKLPRLSQHASRTENPLLGVDADSAKLMVKSVLRSHGYGDGRSTLYRLLERAESDGSPRGLLRRGKGSRSPVDVHEDWYAAAVDHLRATSDGPERLKKSQIYLIDEEFQQSFPEQRTPSRDRKTELLELARRETGTAGRRPTVRGNQPVPETFGRWDEAIPGHLQLDTSNWDLRLLHPSKPGERVRRQVSMLFDAASRQPVAIEFHRPGVTFEVLMKLLMQTVLTPARPSREMLSVPAAIQLPQGHPQHRSLGSACTVHPSVVVPDPSPTGAGLPTVEPALALVNCNAVTVDAGAAETSDRFHQVAAALGITIVYANKRTGFHKPHMERFFGTARTMICEKLGGYTGGAVDRRGRQPDVHASLRPDELKRHVLAWLHDIWRNRVVTYNDRFGFQAIDLSPNQYLELSRRYHGAPTRTVELEDVILSMNMARRVVNNGTVLLWNREYRGSALVEAGRHAGSRLASGGGDGKVTVAYPYKGCDYIYVMDRSRPPRWRHVPAVTPPVNHGLPTAAEVYDILADLDCTGRVMSQKEADNATFERSVVSVTRQWDKEEARAVAGGEADDDEPLEELTVEEIVWSAPELRATPTDERYQWS